MGALSRGHAVVTITVEIEGCNISETTTLVAYSPLKVCCFSLCVCVCVFVSVHNCMCVCMICGKCHVCIKGDLSALWWLFIKIMNCLGVAED